MKEKQEKKKIVCAIYTRVSTAEGLEQEFSSLDAQRESAESYILSQKSEGWCILPDRYDDAGYTGANTERPALQRLLTDIKENKINCVVVYKVDRLSRSLLDFSKLLEFLEQHNVAFVSVTQHFNTQTSMGRLTLNILLSFAQFEREIISERTRDKMGAAKMKGKWIGGRPPLGYNIDKENHKLVINPKEAKIIKEIFDLYLEKRSILTVAMALNDRSHKTKRHTSAKGRKFGGIRFKSTSVRLILRNAIYIGKVNYKGRLYDGQQERIVSDETFQQAQQILTDNRRERKIAGTTKNIGLLSTILRCKTCNSSMYSAYSLKGKYKYQYYLCMNAQKRGYKSCPTKLVNAQITEEKIMECLREITSNSQIEANVWEKLSLQEKIIIFKTFIKEISYDSTNSILEIITKNNKVHKFEVKLSELKHQRPTQKDVEITKEPTIRQNLILAHQIQQLINEKDFSLRQLAQWIGISHSRIYHIESMSLLSPRIQEEIILSGDKRLFDIPEYKLREVISEVDWSKQQEIWNNLLKSIKI